MESGIKQAEASLVGSGLEQDILNNLHFRLAKTIDLAGPHDWYMAVALTVRDRMMMNYTHYLQKLKDKELKIVCYLSAEFLMGPHLGNALINLGIYEDMKISLHHLNRNLDHIMNIEEEPGLGNGGLGRLAACFLDSLTTLSVPAIGYGIRYEFGIFDQQIKNGYQVEITDKWLRLGNPWEIHRPEVYHHVKFGGKTESGLDEKGHYSAKWIPDFELRGVAFDTPVPGYKNNAVNLLRLWKSEAVESFNFDLFNRGDYYQAVNDKIRSETISKILYPNDEPDAGKRLRLSQQYFFVSCSLQDIISIHRQRKLDLDQLPEGFALQLNDTHPSIAVAELMRLLIDEHEVPWDKAWDITKRCLSYTNHTLLPEALEKWSVALFGSLLPRHLEIIYEINQRFLNEVKTIYPGNQDAQKQLSIIDEDGQRSVRMAHLATIGSHAVNGVSALHTELLKHSVLRDFYNLNPGKFFNVTNGVTPRRWIKLYNPKLSDLISEAIGDSWITKYETEISRLGEFAGDGGFMSKWEEIKYKNKFDLARVIKERTGTNVNPQSLFDIQVKRIHEYKRQHLNLLHILHLYSNIKKDPQAAIVPRTFIFGGKAAPGYFLAKLIIKLITAVGDHVNNDPEVADRLKVVFFPDFNVKNSEHIYRAAELSEQISTAGKEASGTGNMKFSMNGALTIGTNDGANVEIFENVGDGNFFRFGLNADEVQRVYLAGYSPFEIYTGNAEIQEVIGLIQSGLFSNGDKNLFQPIVDSLLKKDPFLVLKDFDSYVKCQEKVSEAYKDRGLWTKMSILNVAGMGKFSSDRSIREYCNTIWQVQVPS